VVPQQSEAFLKAVQLRPDRGFILVE